MNLIMTGLQFVLEVVGIAFTLALFLSALFISFFFIYLAFDLFVTFLLSKIGEGVGVKEKIRRIIKLLS